MVKMVSPDIPWKNNPLTEDPPQGTNRILLAADIQQQAHDHLVSLGDFQKSFSAGDVDLWLGWQMVHGRYRHLLEYTHRYLMIFMYAYIM